MTTYKISKNFITVSFDDSEIVICSDTQMRSILQQLSIDFIEYYCSLPLSADSQYFFASELIERLLLIISNHDAEYIIDMLRNIILLVHRLNYPKFRIIFVNEI